MDRGGRFRGGDRCCCCTGGGGGRGGSTTSAVKGGTTSRAIADGLVWMLDNPIDGVLFETFSVTERDVLGVDVVHDLKPRGRDVGVTDANKAEYVKLLVEWHATRKIEDQLCALAAGFHELVPAGALLGLSPDELQRLLMGDVGAVDAGAVRATAQYGGGYADEPGELAVRWFWELMEGEFDDRERAAVLRFATGLPRVPLDGFDPPFTIAKADLHSSDTPADRRTEASMQLPRSHTCFNQLALPPYPSREMLAEKLRFAVFNTDGFHLT